MSFDRKGRCPICKKSFQSDECKHDYWYVVAVLKKAARRKSKTFNKDIAAVSGRQSRK